MLQAIERANSVLLEIKLIPLSRGLVTFIDEWNYEKLSRFKWSALSTGYAVRMEKGGAMILMHRVITDAKTGHHVDHINGNKADNRECNLRLCSPSENLSNIAKHKDNRSGFKGVYWVKRRGRFAARIMKNYKPWHLGYFDDAIEAAIAYDSKCRELHGEFARTNFPK